ncbi:MAG: MOP flippase family protein [Halothermotrichaceae bacterium]
MNDLKNKAVSGVKWSTLYSLITVLISPLTLAILARILTPEEFGKIAIVTIIIGFSRQIARMGFSKAIIQKDEVSDGDLSSIFWFEQLLGFFAFLIIYFSAGLIGSFFDAPGAVRLVRVAALVFIFEPIDLVFRSLLKKELKMKVLKISTSIRLIVVQITKIILAIMGFGAMSFVIGNIVGIFVLTVIMFYIFYKNKLWLPKMYFSFSQLKPYLKFGIFISGKSIFNNLYNYIDEIIIGGILGSEMLGIYHFAKRMLQYVIKLITQPIAEVGFPLLTKMTSDYKKFNRIYIKLIKFIGTVTIPAYAGIAATAPYFVPIIFGAKWIPAIPVIVILSIWGVFHSLQAGVISSALYSFGKSDWMLYATILDLPIRAGLLYLAAPYGIEYIGLTIGFIVFAKFIIYQYVLKYITDISLINIVKELKYIILSSILMLAALYLFDNLISLSGILMLILMIITGVLIYLVMMHILEKQFVYSTVKMIINRKPINQLKDQD